MTDLNIERCREIQDSIEQAKRAGYPLTFTDDFVGELAAKLEAALAEIVRYQEALNTIASWKEGARVRGSFDEPHSAEIAREALYLEPDQNRPQRAIVLSEGEMGIPEPEQNGGNVYRPHRLMVSSAEFWRCRHGSTGIQNAEFIGCNECATDEIEKLRAENQRLSLGNRRYEEMRKWSPAVFINAWKLSQQTGKPFDEIVDQLAPFTEANSLPDHEAPITRTFYSSAMPTCKDVAKRSRCYNTLLYEGTPLGWDWTGEEWTPFGEYHDENVSDDQTPPAPGNCFE